MSRRGSAGVGLAAVVVAGSVLAGGGTALGSVGSTVPAGPWNGHAAERAYGPGLAFPGERVTVVAGVPVELALRTPEPVQVDRSWVRSHHQSGRSTADCERVSAAPEACNSTSGRG